MADQERKNIFEKAINAVSSRDEKEAIEGAMKKMQELEQEVAQTEQKLAASEKKAAENAQKVVLAERKAAELQATLTTTQAELAKTKQAMTAAESRATQAETRIKIISNELETVRATHMQSAQAAVAAAAAVEEAKKKIIAEHTLKADETLSHLALKYYGSAYEPYWRVIYDANQELIGPNPARVRPGMVIKIPVKPENLK